MNEWGNEQMNKCPRAQKESVMENESRIQINTNILINVLWHIQLRLPPICCFCYISTIYYWNIIPLICIFILQIEKLMPSKVKGFEQNYMVSYSDDLNLSTHFYHRRNIQDNFFLTFSVPFATNNNKTPAMRKIFGTKSVLHLRRQ